MTSSTGQRIGYARVSTLDQDPALQLDALRAAGCDRIFEDSATGATADRPSLTQALDHLRAGDTLVVWRLDRLGRSLADLVRVVGELGDREVAFQSLHEAIDTKTSSGRFTFHLFGALAEFERDLIRERTSAGLSAARARGRIGGRPSVMTPEKTAVARSMLTERGADGRTLHTVETVASTIGVSRASVYRALRRTNKANS